VKLHWDPNGQLEPDSLDILIRALGSSLANPLAAAIISDGFDNPSLALEVDEENMWAENKKKVD
jgi:hypothetical protein